MSDDFLQGLDEDFAPAWMGKGGTGVEPGDKIVGRITEISEAWSDQSNSFYPILTIDNEETGKKEAVHVFWITLTNELERWEPQIGERIAILYKEDKENRVAGRKPIKVFRVKIEGKTPKVFRKNRQQQQTGNVEQVSPNIESDPVEDTPF